MFKVGRKDRGGPCARPPPAYVSAAGLVDRPCARVPPPDWVPWYMAPASWYMTHERAHLTTPTATPPAPALLLPPTAPSTATSEPCNHNGMLLGPRVHASDLSLATAPATSVTTAVSLPPTANPFGPRLSAHGLLPATELTTTDPPPALRPLPTASSIYNPMVMERRNLALLDSLALELIDGETEADEHSMDEDDEWDLKAAWCSGA